MNIPPMLEANRDKGLPGVRGKSERGKGSFLVPGGKGFTPFQEAKKHRETE